MYKFTFDEPNNSEQEELMNMTFDELTAQYPNTNEFTMRIKVLSKRVSEIEKKGDRTDIEIIVEYVTVPKGKYKTKKTRPYFPDGRLIWEQISEEEGVEYLVKLKRSADLKKPYYDWAEITPISDEGNEEELIEALSVEPTPEMAAANDPEVCPQDDASESAIESMVAATG